MSRSHEPAAVSYLLSHQVSQSVCCHTKSVRVTPSQSECLTGVATTLDLLGSRLKVHQPLDLDFDLRFESVSIQELARFLFICGRSSEF
jgi:hypothetical protein